MTDMATVLAGRVAELRQAFDRSFAEPIATRDREIIDFVSLRLGGDIHAVRMTDISGLFADTRITPCPSPLPELLGIAGFRGTLTPVYDLAALLGYSASSARWLLLAKGGVLALAFDEFDGHFQVEPAAIASEERSAASRHVREIARQADRAWPVIDIPSVVAAIRRRLPQPAASKE